MLGLIYGPSLGACTVCCRGSLWNEMSVIISTADVVSGPATPVGSRAARVTDRLDGQRVTLSCGQRPKSK